VPARSHPDGLEDGLREMLRPLVLELVRAELDHLPARNPEPSPWLSVREAAAYLRLSEGSVRQMIRRGTLPSHKIEGRRLLHRTELDDLLLRSTSLQDAPAAQQRPGA
jgi:excisionase family DNA binding protein